MKFEITKQKRVRDRYNLYLTPDLTERLNKVICETPLSVTELIRQMIKHCLDDIEGKVSEDIIKRRR